MQSNRHATSLAGLIGGLGVFVLSLCTLVGLRAEEPYVHWATTGPYADSTSATAISPAGELYTYFFVEGLLRFSPTGSLIETNKLERVGLTGLAFDLAGDRYLTGYYLGTNGALGAAQTGFFVARFSVSNELVWVRGWDEALPDNASTSGSAIAVDAQGNIDVTGSIFQQGLFLRQYTSDGLLSWSRRIQKSGGASVYELSVDPTGHVVLCGYLSPGVTEFSGTTVYPGSTGHSYDGDWFLARYNPDGDLNWVQLGYAKSVATDRSGNIYAAFSWGKDGMSGLVKLNPDGDLIWSKDLSVYVTLNGLTVDGNDEPVFTGEFGHTVSLDQFTLRAQSADFQDFFVAKANAQGVIRWAIPGGGIEFDRGERVASDRRGNIYLTGVFRKYPAFFDGLRLVPVGPGDQSTIFAAKLSEAPPLRIGASLGGVNLTWPSKATNYLMEASTAITGAAWTPVEGIPVVSGRDQSLSSAASAPAKYFRLRKP